MQAVYNYLIETNALEIRNSLTAVMQKERRMLLSVQGRRRKTEIR